ncbi:MAG: hypothetical protein EHM58_00080 [Ignavibacteriae bacterium]|nr:MAG: hypothetical protein EHM58_00080 [Ignavibacteriota bacterium]
MGRKQLVAKLETQTAAYFKSKGFRTHQKSKYILSSHDNWTNNIILPDVANYVKKQNVKPLHKYIHHGLSSQACLFNLLGPLVARDDLDTLKEIIGLSGIPLIGAISETKFEKSFAEVFKENSGQPTSIDLFVNTDKDAKVLIEFKFTEKEFGTCSVYEEGECDGSNPASDPTICYLHAEKKREYINLMKKYGLLSTVEYCPFTEFYQAYRMLLTALELKGKFLLIHDERNSTFKYKINGIERGRYLRFIKLLPPDIQKSVSILSIQEIVNFLDRKPGYRWLKEFRDKYM